ncbi:MAG: helix-turn-helix protein [Bacteroidetes bacterium ADurb.Bin123]|nr:MAG: helix-turn-helix protein [Bacteroidetes bacterium ADurb.Bin123]
MDFKKVNAAELADRIGVQRSNVSHILNGRNKPGAQFIEKLLLAYPELDAGWLLTGLGQMLTSRIVPAPEKPQAEPVALGETEKEPPAEEVVKVRNAVSGKVERIVIFYTDRSFVEYFPG